MATLNLGRIKPVFKDAWDNSTAYLVDDIVTDSNETFICILAHTNQATSNATYWKKLAAKGTDGTDLTSTLTTQGDTVYRDGSGLARLPAGTSGQVLQSGGAGANPSWGNVDLDSIRADISVLGLKQATQENSSKHNLPNSSIVTFEADADFNLAGSTTVARNSTGEYIYPAAEATDPNTVLLLHFEDSLGKDSSTNDYTMVTGGNVVQYAAAAKFGSYGGYSDGSSGSHLSTPNIGDAITTENFTCDYWMKGVNSNASMRIFGVGNTGAAASGGAYGPMLTAQHGGSGSVNLYNYPNSQNNPVVSGWEDNSTNWRHHAWQRNGRDLDAWIDGVWKLRNTNFFSASQNMNASGTNNTSLFARSGNTGELYNGYLDEFRLSKVQRYGTTGSTASNFTPETAAYANTTEVLNATGTALGTANVPSSPVTEVSGVILVKSAYGSCTMGTDVLVYFSADGGSNFTEASSYTDSGTFSDTTKMITLGKTTVTEGSDVRWKIVWANQVLSTKEAHVFGISLNY